MRAFSSSRASSSVFVTIVSISLYAPRRASVLALSGPFAKYEATRFFRLVALPT